VLENYLSFPIVGSDKNSQINKKFQRASFQVVTSCAFPVDNILLTRVKSSQENKLDDISPA
jgi:hypothetical protein